MAKRVQRNAVVASTVRDVTPLALKAPGSQGLPSRSAGNTSASGSISFDGSRQVCANRAVRAISETSNGGSESKSRLRLRATESLMRQSVSDTATNLNRASVRHDSTRRAASRFCRCVSVTPKALIATSMVAAASFARTHAEIAPLSRDFDDPPGRQFFCFLGHQSSGGSLASRFGHWLATSLRTSSSMTQIVSNRSISPRMRSSSSSDSSRPLRPGLADMLNRPSAVAVPPCGDAQPFGSSLRRITRAFSRRKMRRSPPFGSFLQAANLRASKYSSGVSARWASEIDRCRRGHRGKMDTRNVSSARSEGNALTMSWCLGNDTVTCCCRTMKYYNETRTHLSLNKDAPISRGVEAVGRILCLPILGGLHHHYSRI